MKSIAKMTRLELASFIGQAFRQLKIDVVLSGGSCVSIYSHEKYVSMDMDFINAGFAKRSVIREAMKSLGFKEVRRYFSHPGTQLVVEFPPGPLAVGQEPVKQIDEIATETGILRIVSPTDCVKDRLAWYYHANDLQCLEQAILVAASNDIDLKELERWSEVEGKREAFVLIRPRLIRERKNSKLEKATRSRRWKKP